MNKMLLITILLLYSLYQIGCTSTPQLLGKSIDCREVVTCSKQGCYKMYKGNECSSEQKDVRERKWTSGL
jgi:hypothetical protein